MKRKIIITIEDDPNPPAVAPQFGEYGRFIPALTAPTRAEHPCTHCRNNPANNPNASGICSCALPDLWQTMY